MRQPEEFGIDTVNEEITVIVILVL